MAKTEKSIYFILSFVVISWGLNIVAVKYLTLYMSPLLVSAIRMPLAGVMLLFFAWKRYGFYRPNKTQWGLLFFIGLTSIFLHQLLLGYGVVTTTATNASLILGLNPLMTAVLAAIFLGEKFHRSLGIGLVLGFTGVVLAVTSKSPGGSLGFSGWGDATIFVSAIGYVTGGLLIKKISSSPIPTLVVTAYSTLIGSVLLNLGTVISLGPSSYQHIQLSLTAWVVALLSAWGASSLGTLGWNYGIKVLGANRTAMFLNGMPFASIMGGFIFLGERIGLIHVVAFGLTTLGIVVGTIKRRDQGLTLGTCQ